MPVSCGARVHGKRAWPGAIRRGRLFAGQLVVAAAVVVCLPALAQEPPSLPPVTVDAPPPKLVLPSSESSGVQPSTTVMAGGRSQPGAADRGHERCVDVTIGNDNSFGCINERFKRKVDEVNPVYNTPPIDAKSSDLKVGTVNIPAVQQQYGRNFGHSVVPYRPTIVYPSAPGRH